MVLTGKVQLTNLATIKDPGGEGGPDERSWPAGNWAQFGPWHIYTEIGFGEEGEEGEREPVYRIFVRLIDDPDVGEPEEPVMLQEIELIGVPPNGDDDDDDFLLAETQSHVFEFEITLGPYRLGVRRGLITVASLILPKDKYEEYAWFVDEDTRETLSISGPDASAAFSTELGFEGATLAGSIVGSLAFNYLRFEVLDEVYARPEDGPYAVWSELKFNGVPLDASGLDITIDKCRMVGTANGTITVTATELWPGMGGDD